MKYLVILAIVLTATAAAPGIAEEEQTSSSSSSYKPVVQYFRSCLDSSDIGTCVAVKGISILNRAARAQSIEIIPGVTFSRKENAEQRSAKSLSENEIMTSLESEKGEKSGRLLDMALEAGSNFLNTHDIAIKIPSETTQEIAKALDEGRGKKKGNKMGGMMMAFGAKMLAMLPLAILALKFLVLKALVVSKIAFFLALMLSASKLMSGGGGFGGGILGKVGNVGSLLSSGGSGGYGGSSGGGWSSGSGSSGWSNGGGSYKRSYDEESHDLAYNGQKQSS